MRELERISAIVSQQIANKGNLYDVTVYQDLIKIALENGFIPTPLLRAQYYGPMELGPEKLKPYLNKFTKKQIEILKNPENYIGIAGKKVEKICGFWKKELKV